MGFFTDELKNNEQAVWQKLAEVAPGLAKLAPLSVTLPGIYSLTKEAMEKEARSAASILRYLRYLYKQKQTSQVRQAIAKQTEALARKTESTVDRQVNYFNKNLPFNPDANWGSSWGVQEEHSET